MSETNNKPSGASDEVEPVTDDKISDKAYMNAHVFVSALKSDVRMRSHWERLMNQIKALGDASDKQKYDQEVAVISNFLLDNGFDCNVYDVLTLLRVPFYIEQQKKAAPTDESDRFVKTVLGNHDLYVGWSAAIETATQSGDTTNDGNSKLDAFLSDHGYKCTALQVDSSFRKMRHQALVTWAGIYRSQLSPASAAADDDTPPPSGKSIAGPIIIVSQTGSVSLNEDRLDKRLNKVKYKDGKLTWSAHHLNVNYSGSLQFSEVIIAKKKDNYTGPEVFGTIDYSEASQTEINASTQQFIGNNQIAARLITYDNFVDTKKIDLLRQIPAHISLPRMSRAMHYLGYFVAGLWGVHFLYSLKQSAPGALAKISEKYASGAIAEKIGALKASLGDAQKVLGSPLESRLIVSSTLSELETASAGAGEIATEEAAESAFAQAIDDAAMGEGWLEEAAKVLL